jgi:hypothetical protein
MEISEFVYGGEWSSIRPECISPEHADLQQTTSVVAVGSRARRRVKEIESRRRTTAHEDCWSGDFLVVPPCESVDIDLVAAADASGDDFNEKLDPIIPNNDNDS